MSMHLFVLCACAAFLRLVMPIPVDKSVEGEPKVECGRKILGLPRVSGYTARPPFVLVPNIRAVLRSVLDSPCLAPFRPRPLSPRTSTAPDFLDNLSLALPEFRHSAICITAHSTLVAPGKSSLRSTNASFPKCRHSGVKQVLRRSCQKYVKPTRSC